MLKIYFSFRQKHFLGIGGNLFSKNVNLDKLYFLTQNEER